MTHYSKLMKLLLGVLAASLIAVGTISSLLSSATAAKSGPAVLYTISSV